MVQTLRTQSTAASRAHSGGRSTTDISSASIQEPEPSHNLDGHLSVQACGMMRYLEPSFWACMAPEVTELDQLLGRQARYLLRSVNTTSESSEAEDYSELEEESSAAKRGETPVHVATWSDRPSRVAEPSSSSNRIKTAARSSEFLEQLPPKVICDKLISSYLRGYHPIVPLIHVPTFRQRYASLWATYSDADTAETVSMSFVTLLVAICYAGSVAIPERLSSRPGEGPEPDDVAQHLHELGLQGLELTFFPKLPTVETLTAYLLLHSTLGKEEEPLVCANTCVRFALITLANDRRHMCHSLVLHYVLLTCLGFIKIRAILEMSSL
jgi:hypothetical protein